MVSGKNPNEVYNVLLRYYRSWERNARLEYHGQQDCIEQYEVQTLTQRLAQTISAAVETFIRSWTGIPMPTRCSAGCWAKR